MEKRSITLREVVQRLGGQMDLGQGNEDVVGIGPSPDYSGSWVICTTEHNYFIPMTVAEVQDEEDN